MHHLKLLRLKAGIKFAKSASTSLKISYNYIRLLEIGEKKPSIELIYKMAVLYKCSCDDIVLPYFTTDSCK